MAGNKWQISDELWEKMAPLIPEHRTQHPLGTHRKRTHSWMNRYRRVLTRWEKKVENYEAMLHLACAIIVWNKILLG
ncbi:hypothetical protein AWP95_17165 [Escherichia coli]|nr:hypothetical protein AWP95_17165 [Escherichia coli]